MCCSFCNHTQLWIPSVLVFLKLVNSVWKACKDITSQLTSEHITQYFILSHQRTHKWLFWQDAMRNQSMQIWFSITVTSRVLWTIRYSGWAINNGYCLDSHRCYVITTIITTFLIRICPHLTYRRTTEGMIDFLNMWTFANIRRINIVFYSSKGRKNTAGWELKGRQNSKRTFKLYTL